MVETSRLGPVPYRLCAPRHVIPSDCIFVSRLFRDESVDRPFGFCVFDATVQNNREDAPPLLNSEEATQSPELLKFMFRHERIIP